MSKVTNDELKKYKGTVSIFYGMKFKMKVKNIEEIITVMSERLSQKGLLKWGIDDVSMFWVSVDENPLTAFGAEECFVTGDRLKNGSYSIDVTHKGEDKSFEYEMPYSEEKCLGLIYESEESETPLKEYAVMVTINYARENFDILGYDAEDAAGIIVRTVAQSDLLRWRDEEMVSFNIKADEEECLGEDIELSYEAVRLESGNFEITKIINGAETKVETNL